MKTTLDQLNAVMRMNGIVLEEAAKEDLAAHRLVYTQYDNDVNPSAYQTSSGIILYYHTHPSRMDGGEMGPFIADTHYYDFITEYGVFRRWFNYHAIETNEQLYEFLSNNGQSFVEPYAEAMKVLGNIKQRVLKRLNGKEHPHSGNEDTYKIFYALHTVDDISLPTPKLKGRTFYEPYQFCIDTWNQMAWQYEREHKNQH